MFNRLAVAKTAAVSGTNTINISTAGSSLTPGAYNLIIASGGLDGTFRFGNGLSAETVAVGGIAYTLTLSASATAVTVTVALPTGIAVTASPSPSTFGQAVTFTATVTRASGTFDNGGTVQFQVDGSNYGSPVGLSGGHATIQDSSLSAGGHTITASYGGDTDFLASMSTSIPQAVSQAVPTISWSAPTAITYGTARGATQLDATANVPGTFSYSPASGTVLHAGTTQLSVSFTPTDATDYTTASASVNLTVGAAPLTVTADNQGMTYGASLPTLTASYGGFVNGDSAAGLTTQPTLSTAATAASPVGTYPITAGGAADPDYSIGYVGGTLTVDPANVTVSNLVAESKTYDGTTAATLDFRGASLSGILGPDNGNVSLDPNNYTANFVNAEPGTGIGVTVSALGLTGSAADDYVVSPLPSGLSADIAPILRVTTNPTGQAIVPAGTATFTAVADAAPAASVQWKVSTDGGSTFSVIPGATSTTYSFTASAVENGYQYEAVFTNSAGSATTAPATLTVSNQLYWNQAAAGSRSAWDASAAEWNMGGPSGPLVTWTDGCDAIFLAGTGSVTVGNPVTVGVLTVDGGTLDLNGQDVTAGDLTSDSGGTGIVTDSGAMATLTVGGNNNTDIYYGGLTGNLALTLAVGTGSEGKYTLCLDNAGVNPNTYTGPTTINPASGGAGATDKLQRELFQPGL